MARIHDKEIACSLRKEGKSYAEIRSVLKVSKSTLSGWLSGMPLSREQINQMRAHSPRRIEKFRQTMRLKKETRLDSAFRKADKDIGNLSGRDLFIAGLYLYWGEGTKAAPGRVEMSNTDPDVIKAFMDWMACLGVAASDMRFRLHLYSDMDVVSETTYWSEILGITEKQFQRPYIKQSTLAGLTYKRGYGHGTCNARLENMAMWEYITMALKNIRARHSRP